jgi:DNA-directed RNA polymerase subunit M/transcription elongation factor TFIIS
MESIDPQQQWRELRETYGQMSEDELCAVAEDARDLTPVAKEALQAEISERGLNIQLKTVTASLEDQGLAAPDKDGLVYLCPVWSEEGARYVQDLLNTESIPSYLGPDNVRRVEDFKRFFGAGVDVKVAAADRDRAMAALEPAEAEDGRELEDEEEFEDEEEQDDKVNLEDVEGLEEGKDYVLCPKCQSPEVDIESDPQIPPDDATIPWRCNVCSHKWKAIA